jgi:glucan phosphoethanolaminetransferase (alkaline phosphatase superfamily)
MLTMSSHHGFGRDMDEIIAIKGSIDGMEAITRAILYSAIGQTVLVFGIVLSKTSLALFLTRLVTARRDRVAIWVPDFFLATAVVASLFVFWFSCQPTQYLWDRRLEGECTIDPGPISMYAGSWSVILDFWYAAFPWWMLWKIQMPKRDKVIIATSMSLGVFAGACGIKRAIELRNLGSPNYLSTSPYRFISIEETFN